MSHWKKVVISLGVTIAIVLGIVLIPSQTSALDITVSGPSSVDKPAVVCFTATLTFQSGERIPISSLEAILTGATDVTIVFDTDGNVTNVTGDLDASHVGASISRMEDYGYGYGYTTGYEGGYGYDFGYGYGYYADDSVVRYVICINTTYLTPGDHNIQVKVKTGMPAVNESFDSSLRAFHLDGTTTTFTTVWNEYTWERPGATLSQIDTIIGLGANEALSKWNNTTKQYESYISGLGGDNPTLNPGDPVWIGVTADKPFEM